MLGLQNGRYDKKCAVCVPFPCEASEIAPPPPDLIATDLARLVTPGLRSHRVELVALPHLMVVQLELANGASSFPDAIENVVNRGLIAMGAHTHECDIGDRSERWNILASFHSNTG